MKNLLPLLIFFLASQSVFSQSPNHSKLFAIKFTPTSFFNPHYPSALLGVEYLMNDDAGIQFELGLQTKPALPKEEDNFRVLEGVDNRQYLKLKLEKRKYRNHRKKEKEVFNPFYGYGLLFTLQSYEEGKGVVILKNNQKFSYTKAKYRQDSLSFYISFGSRIWLTDRLTFELYGGIGLKGTFISVRDLQDKTLISNHSEDYGGPFTFWDPNDNYQERIIPYPFFDLGLKFGYAF